MSRNPTVSADEEQMLKIILAEQELGMLNTLIKNNDLEIVEKMLLRGKVDAKTFADAGAGSDGIATIYHCQSPEMLRLLVRHGGKELITKKNVLEGVTFSFVKLALTTHDLKMVRCLFEEFHAVAAVDDTMKNALYYTARNKASRKAWDEKKEDDVFLYIFEKFPELAKIKMEETEGGGEYPITPILARGDIAIIRAALENPIMKAALLGINFDNGNNIIHEMVKTVSRVKGAAGHMEGYAINPRAVENYKRIIRLFSENFPEFLSQKNHDGLTPFSYAARANELDLAQEMFEVCPNILARDSNLNEAAKIALIPAVVRGKKEVSEDLILAALDEKMFDLFSHLRAKATEKLFSKFLPKIYEKLCAAIKENDIESAVKIAEIFPEFIERKHHVGCKALPKSVRHEATLEEDSIEDEGEAFSVPTIGFALELGREEIVNAFHKILEKKFPMSGDEIREFEAFKAKLVPSEKVAAASSEIAQSLGETTIQH
jgi:hypothetical protein